MLLGKALVRFSGSSRIWRPSERSLPLSIKLRKRSPLLNCELRKWNSVENAANKYQRRMYFELPARRYAVAFASNIIRSVISSKPPGSLMSRPWIFAYQFETWFIVILASSAGCMDSNSQRRTANSLAGQCKHWFNRRLWAKRSSRRSGRSATW